MLEVVERLNGSVVPVGSSHVDEKRLHNLKNRCALVGSLVNSLIEVAEYRNYQQHSMRECGKEAFKFLTEVIGVPEKDLEVEE